MRMRWGRTKEDARDDYTQIPAMTTAHYVPMSASAGPYITEAVGLHIPKSMKVFLENYDAVDWKDEPAFECEYCGPLSTNELSRDKTQCKYCGGPSLRAVWGE